LSDPVSRAAADAQSPRLDARAMDNLAFIRDTMERAGSFTAVPGIGMMVIGAAGLIAAAIAPSVPSKGTWLVVWLAVAAFAVLVSAASISLKAKSSGISLNTAPGRKFALSFAPPLTVGAILTAALVAMDVYAVLPGVWLLLYGTAVVTGGAFSVRIVPLMGLCFLLVGVVALLTPIEMSNHILAAGFGGLHLLFGFQIARRHGG
jgi:hypothetical protein